MSAIAIVGMGCRFAGAADLHAYWDLAMRGEHHFGPVPANRWTAASFYSENRRAIDKTYAPNGAFIQDIRTFPALALGLPPRRVEVMDPQQRFSIEVCLQAIQDAGVTPADLPERTGIYMGVTATEYRTLLSTRVAAQLMADGTVGTAPDDVEGLTDAVNRVVPTRPYTAPGVLGNMVACAVAQELDLHGPAYTVDAACASALIAVTNAVQQLRNGSIDAAVAGGAYLQITPDHYLAFSRIGALSASGVCRPFDHRADGFIQGDGAGAILLKRLEDAERDGDRIYAVINGAAFNNDGRGDGPMAPVAAGQLRAVQLAWDDAKIDPSSLGYIETHGTGTAVGDVTEFKGLLSAFGDTATNVAIGSSKGNVGHTMSAAGIAGMIRTALAIYHQTIPPMANFEHPKDALPIDGSGFYIPTAPRAWDGAQHVAGVSSFGFGGTNAHIVLSDSPARATAPAQAELVCLSAPDEATLRDIAARTSAWMAHDLQVTPAGVARAWAVRRVQPARLAVVATDAADLIKKLTAYAKNGFAEQVFTGTQTTPAKVAFLYPGQGSQRPGMLADACARFPTLADGLRALEVELTDDLPVPLTHLLYPERRDTPISADDAEALLTDTANQQPALLACGVALTGLLASVGVTPTVVTGHSLGEFTAATTAGVLTPGDAARFVSRRGARMAALTGDHGAMAAIMSDADTVRALLVDGAVIANINHPRQLVISGDRDAVATVVAAAQAAEIKAVPLKVSHGFHSPALADLDLTALLDALPVSDPTLPVASGVGGAPYRDAADARGVFTRHAVSTVDFVGALQQCVDAGADVFLQVGAGGPLGAFARGTLDKSKIRGVFNLAGMDDDDGGVSLLEGLGRLWSAGVNLDVRAIAGASTVATVPPEVLPRQSYWAVKQAPQTRVELRTGSAAVAAADVTPQAADNEPEVDSGDAVLDGVLRVVAKVSAYPLDAVRVDLRLIEDLGFDSLMVNDLATGLADAFPGLGGIPQELLINRPSVQDMVDFVRGARGQGAAAVNDHAPLSAFVPTWRDDAGDDLPDRALAPSRVRVLGHGTLAEALARAFTAAGHAVVTDDTATVFVHADVNHDALPPSAVVAGEAPCPDPASDLLTLLAAHPKGGDVLVLRSTTDPWSEARAGVARCAPLEWPGAVGKAIAVTPATDPATAAAFALREWQRADTTVDVRCDAGDRAVRSLLPAAIAPVRWTPTSDDTVVITGGTRGIGASLAARLVADGAKVVLVGRSAPSDEAQALIDTNKAVLAIADVTDRDALLAAIAPHGPVTAAVHCAGLLADGPVSDVDPVRAATARAVKAAGWLNLLAACPSAEVVLGIGSWAGRFGNRHQMHYASANALLSGLAQTDPRAVIAELGPWAASEMVRSIPAAVQASMRAEGVDFVGPEVGVDALITDLQRGHGALVHGRDLPPSLRTASFTTTLSVKTHPFLADHAIDGHPVLPLAAAADALARIAAPGDRFVIEDLKLFQGVVVDAPTALTSAVRADRATVRVGERSALAYQARVRPLGDLTVVVPDAPTGGKAPARTLAEFYDFTFHGPLLAGIQTIDTVGDTFVTGTVATAIPSDWEPGSDRARFAVDPLALDSAMQLSAYVAWTRYGRAGTPVALGRYVQLAPTPTGPLHAEVHFGPAVDDRFQGTIVFRDADGQPVAIAEDLVAELRQVDDATPAFDAASIDPEQWPEVKDLKQRLEGAALIGLRNPFFAVHDGTAKNTTSVAGRELVNYSSYNYVGLSGDPRVTADVARAVETYGTSVSASRVASGERPFHGELEALLAKTQGAEAALVFTAGHATNVSTLGHLFGKDDLFLHDELIHDSAIQGMRLAGSARRSFKHDDPADLERQLKQLRSHYRRVCVVIEGVYSMDGDICDLPAYIAIKKKYGCILFVDEAHSFGIIGENGHGIAEHFHLDGREVDLWMGTLSKSMSSCGGWIAGSATMIEYLKYTCPGFVYSAGLTPANGQAALSSLTLLLAEPWRAKKLQANAKRFHSRLHANGLDTGPADGESGVVPVVTGNSMHALVLSQRLVDQGINVQPIVYPAVADDAARLRFFLSSTHTDDQLDWTADVVAETLAGVQKEYKL